MLYLPWNIQNVQLAAASTASMSHPDKLMLGSSIQYGQPPPAYSAVAQRGVTCVILLLSFPLGAQ